MESKIPLAVGPVCKAKRFKINAQQMNCKDSCSHRWGCSNVPLGGSAAMEGRLISEPRAAGNGQHMGLLEEIVGSKLHVPTGCKGSLPAFEWLGYSSFTCG